MAQSDAHPLVMRLRVNPHHVWQHFYVAIDHEIISAHNFSLPLIQECAQVLVNHLED